MPQSTSMLGTSRRSVTIEETLPLSNKSTSLMRVKRPNEILTTELPEQRRSSQMRAKLPKIDSKRHIDISQTPLPTLPFPRVLGKDIISPFPGSQEHLTLKRIIAQHQAQASALMDSQNLTASTSQQMLLQSYRNAQGPGPLNSSQSASQLKGLQTSQTLLHNQSTLSLISPADKTLAILESVQRRNQNNKTSLTHHQSFQQLLPLDQSKILNNTIEATQLNHDQSQGALSALILKNAGQQRHVESVHQRKIPVQADQQHKLKPTADIKKFMMRQGIKPSPLEFIRLVQLDPEFKERFCYCNRKEDYYDFEIVPFNEKNDGEYMTVSQRGIVHFIKGEANFMSVSEWEREHRIYKQIQNISFFQQYRTWKTFSAWKTLMRRTMIFKTSDFLNRELFILDSELSKPLLDIRFKTFNIQKMQMISLHTEKPKNMSEFFEHQDKQRKSVADALVKIEKEIKTSLIESCDNSMRTFREENRISLNDNQEDDDNEEAEPFLVGDETHKQMPYTQEATTRTHYKKLAKYIRLTDYMIIDSKLRLITNSISNVLKILKYDYSGGRKYLIGDKIQQVPLFEVTVDFQLYELFFSPTKYEVRDAIKSAITEGINTVCKYELFVHQPEFETYVNVQEQEDHLFDDQNDLMSLAIGSDMIVRDTELIASQIDSVYSDMKDFAKVFDYFIQIYNENVNMQVEDFRHKEHEFINHTMNKLIAQIEEIEQLDVKGSIRVVRFDGEKMKKRIRESPRNCLRVLQDFIPKFQYEKLDALCETLKVEFEKVSRKPVTVDQFVVIQNDLKELSERFDNLATAFQEIEQYNILMDEHKIKLPDKNKAKFKETQTLLINTRKKMEEGLEAGEVEEQRFKKILIDVETPRLNKQAQELLEVLSDAMFANPETAIQDAVQKLEEIGKEVQQMKERGKQLNQYQKFLDLEETTFEAVNDAFNDWNMKFKLWQGLDEWIFLSRDWTRTRFNQIEVEEIQKQVDKFDKAANICAINLKDNPVTQIFKEKVEVLKSTMPVVSYLRSDLEERHWEEIYEIIGMKLDLNAEDFTLQSLIDLNVKKEKDKIGEIAQKADKERELQSIYEKVFNDWKKAQFETKLHKDPYYILGTTEEVNALLEESMVTLSNVLGARFVDIIREDVEALFKKLQYIENLLNEWQTFQRTWIYLENIMNGSDIAQKLGQDAKRFQQIDAQWREIMKQVHNNSSVFRTLGTFKDQLYLDIFRNNNSVLDQIQKSLEILLEKKRTEFPRFYFLSNDELLSILAEASKDPQCVQPHLRKLFENINRITFEYDEITWIISAEEEKIKIKKVKTGGTNPVEKWLLQLQENMLFAVKKFIGHAHVNFKEEEEFKRHKWVMEDHPAQGICVVASIQWCTFTENMLKEDEDVREGLQWWLGENIKQLQELTKIVSMSDLDYRKRLAVVALITQDVHYRDIIEDLIKEDVESHHDFKWQQQLRYYYANEEITIKQVNASLDYGYEYLGAHTRLVITPLTDRCWMTITGSLHIKLGAAPAGPAGTGKTESTKDLAKGLGKYCVVFNCSDQINYKMMEQLFSGLATTGSWACLDEFNRIDIEVLSVIAQQLLTIRNAMLADRSEFQLGDRFIGCFVPTMGVFITMNPGYKGRTELPDNLKVLFRPVSMMIPDYALIAEIMLFAEGFQQAKILSRKMTKLFKLSSEQLSQQAHYDFGMRAVKSVLVMAGQVKRGNPKMAEDLVLIKAMRDSNIPKFIKEDLPLFNAIVRDLFPTSQLPEPQYEVLINAINETQAQENITSNEEQTEKIIQFYETMNVRFGMMIIGQTLTGKTTIIRSLKNAMNHIKKSGYSGKEYSGVDSRTLNPKSISMDELYGSFSHLTQEWTDGLASNIVREFVKSTSEDMKWVIFDGPVDAIWIENMNTVLDDNMTLCLSSGERIRLRKEMRMIFEVDDLSQASPATVSRCGMVYASPSTLTWRPIVTSWINQVPETLLNAKQKEYLQMMFETHIDNTIELVRGKGFKEPIPTVDNNFVISMCRLLQAILEHAVDVKVYEGDRQKKALLKAFIYALAWSFGGSIDSQHYSSFEVYLGTVFNISDLPKTSIFDNQLVQGHEIMEYAPWTQNLPKFEYSNDKSFFELVVPTKDTVRFSWLLKQQLLNGNPVFFTGITGVGKSIIANSTLQEMKKQKNYETILLSFSSQTSSKETQFQIEDKLERRRRNWLIGPMGRKVALFIDDVNMPAYDNYGTQMPIELLRQFLDFQGLYDREYLEWKKIQDTTLICAAAPPEGGRKVLSKRFTRHFHMICLPPTQEESLQMIFSSIVDGFFKPFKKEVQMLSKPMVDSTLLVFNKITKTLRPTPNKSHYTFNLRDISKIFQGICMAKLQTLNRNDKIIKLWIHETCRVFHDRLVSAEDKSWFNEMIIELIKHAFRVDWTQADLFESKPLIFGDFMKRGIAYEERQYDEVRDIATMSQVILDYQEEYNIDHVNKFDLVLFPECLQHISRVCRILRQPRGNALLVGVGGSGKQTITRLAAFIADCQFATLEVKKNFNQNDFRENIKKAMLSCGIKGERTTFLINDNQITNESFLEDVNNLLNSGEIPNLWAQEDKDLINNDLRKAAAEHGVYENIYGFFLQRMRDQLHAVLCLSPVGESFRMRIRMFPSLVNCCAINWIDAWPEEALLSVSARFIQKVDQIKEPELRDKIAQMCVVVHKSVEEEATDFYDSLKRKVYTTPKSYLDLIKSYSIYLHEKHKQLSDRRNTLFTGLSKLSETNAEVAKLSEDLITLQPSLEQSVVEAEQMSRKLEKDKIEANKKKMVVEEEKKIVDKKAAEVTAQYDVAMTELEAVMPILLEAEAALDTLNSGDITEIRGTKAPSKGILNTIILIYMLLEKKHDFKKVDWKMCQQQVLTASLQERLKTFKKDDVPERVVKGMDKFIQENPDFTLENVKNSSKACFSLAKWCLAIKNYAKVAKEIEPKKKLVEEMDAELRKAQADLQAKENKLREEMKKVEDLERAFIEVKEKRENLEAEIELCRKRLGRAEKLTNGLGSEHERWKENVGILDGKIRQLVGDVFVAAACISYYAPFTGVFREKLVDKWVARCLELEIPVSEKFKISEVMGDPMEIQNWNMNGLPSDSVSISNGIIVKYGTRKPLMIDPQQQATKWIRTMYTDENIQNQKDVGQLKICRMGAKDMIKTMELCIKNGFQLLIEDMGEFTEPAFEPVLLDQTFKSPHGRLQMNFGDTIIDYDPRFKLYMTTKMPNPHYLPEMFIRVNVINFTVTQEGLEQQLLAEIVKLESPSIEVKKLELTRAIVNDQKRMKKIEDDILNQLVNSRGNILDEEDLISFLDKSKVTSQEIKHAMEENEIAQVEIEEARSKYQIVAERGSILYFVIADLAGIDPMYQYSLLYFLRLHNQIIAQSEKAEDQVTRIGILMREITSIVYSNICRGLFNSHKLIFAFMIATRIAIQANNISLPEWNLLLKGVIIDGDIKPLKNPDSQTITDKTWRLVLNLECTHPLFEGLAGSIAKDLDAWRSWYKSKDPQNLELPGGWEESLSRFQKLLIFKAFREDKLVFKMREFVEKELGHVFAHPQPVLMDDVFKDSDNKTPIIFVLSQGAEPTALFLRFAKKIKGDRLDAFQIISLGQGQDKFAIDCIEKGCKHGTWVLLQNCHLYKSFMPGLEKQVLDITENAGSIHPDFRLFLTSMPVGYFPVSVLQNGIKLTNEPPKGIKANVLGSLTQLTEEKLDGCKRDAEYRQLLFSICFFHAVIQERRKFGPLGWNIRYEFNESDFETATTVIKGMLNEESDDIVWNALQQVTGDIVYGGRVTDDIDRRTLMMILTTFLSEEVLSPGYKYSDSGIYTPAIPEETSLEGLLNKARALPDVDNPEIFGMNDNADIAFQLQESLQMIETILSVQPRTGGSAGGGKNPDQIIEELCIKIEAELPELLTREGAAKELFVVNKEGLLPSLTTFLLQEIERFNKLVVVMAKSLDTMKKALIGEAVMGDDIDRMYKSMLNNKVPDMWAFHAYPSLKPLSSWIENLKERIEFLKMWLLKGKLPAYWLPAFFFPQGFLTALLQNCARKYQIPIDALNFGFQFQTFYNIEDVDAHPGDGVFFYGFFMESGVIHPDTLQLEDAGPGQKFSVVPMIKFNPEKDHQVNDKDFLCPLFKTTERAGTLSTTGHSTNFVIMVEVPSRKLPKHWVLRGTALFCQLDD